MKGLDRIACPALVVHARQDELTSLRSAHYLVERIGVGKRAGQARMVVLEDSYHMHAALFRFVSVFGTSSESECRLKEAELGQHRSGLRHRRN